jgi:hypothetical protein
MHERWLLRLATLDLVVLIVAVVSYVQAQLSWADLRPHCSGLAMKLRPELADQCFAGPRPLLIDGSELPVILGVAAVGLLVTLAWTVRSGRTPRG